MNDQLQQYIAAGQFAHDTETIRAEYPEIFEDQRLAQMAHQTVHSIWARDMAAGRVRPGIDVYREAGDSVRDLVGHGRGRGDGDLASRQQAAADAAAQRQHDVVAEMRRGRGQL